jgi:hypothetical protein
MPQANTMEVQNVTAKRSAIGMLVRWRTELGYLGSGLVGFLEADHCIGLDLTAAGFGGTIILAAVLPSPRRSVLLTRFRCLLTRHRLQALFWELRFHTRRYQIPLVLWIRPTPVGERAVIFTRPGLCAADFTKTAAEIASACIARDSRVTVSPRFSALVTIDVIRRDVLGPSRQVISPLATLADVSAGQLAPAELGRAAEAGRSWPVTGWQD